jgi:uncharacterized membrane protein
MTAKALGSVKGHFRTVLIAYLILTGIFGFIAFVVALFIAYPVAILAFLAGVISGVAVFLLKRDLAEWHSWLSHLLRSGHAA